MPRDVTTTDNATGSLCSSVRESGSRRAHGSQVDVLVAGGGGFIGGHLVADLLAQGKSVRAVDVKPLDEWYQVHERRRQRRRRPLPARRRARAHRGCATRSTCSPADMGGMGFIENNKALCMMTVLTNTHLLQAAQEHEVERFFYSSSACVYAADKQTDTEDHRAEGRGRLPRDAGGRLRLGEALQRAHVPPLLARTSDVTTRVARYHNVYGPNGTWTGGREKAPAAVCRKVVAGRDRGQARARDLGRRRADAQSFMYIDDCVKGSQMILGERPRTSRSTWARPRASRSTSCVHRRGDRRREAQAEVQPRARPRACAGRNSDNTLIKKVFGWEPSITLADGLARTYAWVYDQVKRSEG